MQPLMHAHDPTMWILLLQEKRTKQVVMGRLGASESFAELSILLNEQITCSVVTATDMTLGVIKPDRIKG